MIPLKLTSGRTKNVDNFKKIRANEVEPFWLSHRTILTTKYTEIHVIKSHSYRCEIPWKFYYKTRKIDLCISNERWSLRDSVTIQSKLNDVQCCTGYTMLIINYSLKDIIWTINTDHSLSSFLYCSPFLSFFSDDSYQINSEITSFCYCKIEIRIQILFRF